jgi:hypothetical protein
MIHLKHLLQENVEVNSKAIIAMLLGHGLSRANINLIKLSTENVWVIQIIKNNNIIAAIKYPAMDNETAAADKTVVEVDIAGVTVRKQPHAAVQLVVNQFKS